MSNRKTPQDHLPPRHLATVKQAAARGAVSVWTIRRMIADGRLTGYRIPGTTVQRVDLLEVDAMFTTSRDAS